MNVCHLYYVWLWLLFLGVNAADAGGRGGHNTTFDPNLFGGPANVACFASAAIPGVCNTGYSAGCNGVADDTVQEATYRTAAIAANPALSVLYVAPGKNCNFEASGGDHALTYGIKNVVVWAYGATFTGINFGSLSPIFGDSNHHALLQTFNPGDASVVLVTAADASKFNVGDWVLASCISLQQDGFPQNFNRFNFRLVTSKTGTTTITVGLSSPLNILCKSTYPANTADQAYQGGPATLYAINQNWNTNATFYGGTISSVGKQWSIGGRDVALVDVNYGVNSIAPTVAGNVWVINGMLNDGEIDKIVDNAYFVNGFIGNPFQFQSASNNNVYLYKFNMVSTQTLSGTPTNLTVVGGTMNVDPRFGPTSFAGGNSISLDGTAVTISGNLNVLSSRGILASEVSYSNGVFSVSKSGPNQNIYDFFGNFVPGIKYQFGWSNSSQVPCNPDTTFAVTDMSEDASNIYATTGSWKSGGSTIATPAALPTPTCGSTPLFFNAYPANTITQINSPAGSSSITGYAAPP